MRMVEQRIEDRIKEIIVERLFLKVQPSDIADDDALMEKLGVDSVSVFEIVVGLEEVFRISFEDDEFQIEKFKDVASIAAHVREKQAK